MYERKYLSNEIAKTTTLNLIQVKNQSFFFHKKEISTFQCYIYENIFKNNLKISKFYIHSHATLPSTFRFFDFHSFFFTFDSLAKFQFKLE